MGKSVQQVIETQIEAWSEDVPDELAEVFIEMVEVGDDAVEMTIGEEELSFSLCFSKVLIIVFTTLFLNLRILLS